MDRALTPERKRNVRTRSELTIEHLRALATGQEPVEPYLFDVLAAMQMGDEESRAWASDALERVRNLSPEAAPALAELCHNDEPSVVGWACRLLAKLGAVGGETSSGFGGSAGKSSRRHGSAASRSGVGKNSRIDEHVVSSIATGRPKRRPSSTSPCEAWQRSRRSTGDC